MILPQMSLLTMKQGAILFWTIWLALVFLGNLCDFLKHLGVLNKDWKFASGNYELIHKTTDVYHLPETAVRILFVGVLIWEALATLLMGAALISFSGDMSSAVYTAFGVSLGLWAAFLIADEVFVAYPMEPIHFPIFIAQLITLLALYLLPNAK